MDLERQINAFKPYLAGHLSDREVGTKKLHKFCMSYVESTESLTQAIHCQNMSSWLFAENFVNSIKEQHLQYVAENLAAKSRWRFFVDWCQKSPDDELLFILSHINLFAAQADHSELSDFVASHLRTNNTSIIEALTRVPKDILASLDSNVFNQLILKALFVGVEISHHSWLYDAMSLKLKDMIMAYKLELESAGRDLSEDMKKVVKTISN